MRDFYAALGVVEDFGTAGVSNPLYSSLPWLRLWRNATSRGNWLYV
jgi:hypothetical protein